MSSIKRLVVKIGSALLTDEGRGLNLVRIDQWVEQLASLKHAGLEVVLVSSGSVAEGLARLGIHRRPKSVPELQAAAAVGQMGLVQAYEASFRRFDLHTAQILLTHDDLSDRERYLNSQSTLAVLLRHSVIPIVNENDTVVTDEIRFGDNDTLAALVTNLLDADRLIILTDQDGLFNKDPRIHEDAKLVSKAQAADASLDAMVAGKSGPSGRGGMYTKLRAARLASRSGASTVIANGKIPRVIEKVVRGEAIGTQLDADRTREAARKQWLAGHLRVKGELVLDLGAVEVLRKKGRSLLAVGVRAVKGDFRRGEVVRCVNEAGNEIARGLVNYDAIAVRKILGKPSSEIETVLGFINEDELIHRDNLVVVG